MTNKLRGADSSASTVYHEIRVDKEIPDDLGALGKLRLIYNGISANAWLTPVGIRHVKPPRTSYSSETLPNELKTTIRDRAATANGIMGRRHFELDRQELGKGEMILGVKMGDKRDSDLRIGTAPKVNEKERRKSKIHPCFERRVKTADLRMKCETELPDLTITQMMNSSRSENKESPNGEAKKRVMIVEDEGGFKSLKAMHEAYKNRTKSAPLRKADKEKDLVRSSTSMMEHHPVYKGPTLKPLLGTEKDDGMCTDVNCKGCFRACLASDEFFQKERFNEIQKPASPRVPRRKISYRLRPALRMAFLEQLAISKTPQARDEKIKKDVETPEDK